MKKLFKKLPYGVKVRLQRYMITLSAILLKMAQSLCDTKVAEFEMDDVREDLEYLKTRLL